MSTGVDDEVPMWPVTMLRPAMTMRVGAAAPEVVDALARGLDSAKYRTKDRTAHGFRGVYFRWGWLVALETAYRTELLVDVGDGVVSIATGRRELASPPRRYAARGLNAAVAELRSRGVGVHWTPWTEQSP